jgi:hypothetical protein
MHRAYLRVYYQHSAHHGLVSRYFIYTILAQHLEEEGQKKKKNTANNLTKTNVLRLRTHGGICFFIYSLTPACRVETSPHATANRMET